MKSGKYIIIALIILLVTIIYFRYTYTLNPSLAPENTHISDSSENMTIRTKEPPKITLEKIVKLQRLHQQVRNLKQVSDSSQLSRKKNKIISKINDLKTGIENYKPQSPQQYFVMACKDLIRFANAIEKNYTSQLLMNFEQSFESNIILTKDNLKK